MLAHLISGLKANGEDVSLVCLNAETHNQNQSIIEGAGAKIHFVRKRPGFDPATPMHVHRLLTELKPDVVHTHLSSLAYASLAPAYGKVPRRVHTVHTLAEKEAPNIYLKLHGRAFRKGTVPVAIASAVEQSIRNQHQVQNVPCIPNGIPIADYAVGRAAREETRRQLGIDSGTPVIVQVGRLFSVKNPLNLLNALTSPHLRDLDFKCLFVGDGPLRGEVEAFIAANGLVEKVKLLGVRTDVVQILAACDVFALSSDWEGHPMCILEAMASSVPVVSTDVGGVAEQLGDGRYGVMVPPQDSEALAAGLRKVLTSPELAAQLAQGALREVEKYDIRVMANSYSALYRA